MNFKYYTKRLFALLIDLYSVGIFLTIPNFILWGKVLAEWDIINYLIIYQIVSACLYILYWYLLEKYYQTTIGKKIMKLKVIENKKSNYFIRSICKFLPLDILSFLLTKDGRFWHDVFSNTEIVEIEKIH